MEDGFPLFDPNSEADRQEQKLREYYEEFSANARKRLLAKTIVRPTSVYDVLYPQTRVSLLAKNIPINNDLEENAKIIRDKLIAKIVIEETDLEKISADFRNSLLARAKIQDDRNNLVRNADAYRKTNLSKNLPKDTDLERDSNFARVNNTSKNRPNPSLRGNIEDNSESYKDSNLSKNTSKDQDLLRDSDAFRTGDIHKNVSKESDLEKDSDSYRDSNLAKNAVGHKSLQEIADSQREQQLAKNAPKPSDIESDSSQFRVDDISKNNPKGQDLLRDSEDIRNQFRKNDINKNVHNDSDLEVDSKAFRKNNLSSNKPKVSDIESDSVEFRSDGLSKNNPKSSDLEVDSVIFRTDDLSLNKPKSSDLAADSVTFRADDLSANKPVESNLEKDSSKFRADDLYANKPKVTDIEKDSSKFRADDLSANKPKFTDIESDSVPFRTDDLALNKPKTSNLEVDSEQFRADDLSANKPKLTNIESDSVPFRNDDLSFNVPKFTDLEIDSIPFRKDDLSFNKPKLTDLEVDSVSFRDDDLSFNVPKFTNLETDSVQFRVDDLAANTPNVTDLEVDSVPFRNDDLSANVPNVTDLITDSTPFLYSNLSSNIPGTSDIEIDSVPFRADDLAANVPGTSDLLFDSATFRTDDLAANAPNTSNLLIDSIPFRNDDLSVNVPTNSNIQSDSVQFRSDALASNVPYSTNLLLDSQTFRQDAVSKNAGYGLLGVNVQGAGTSAFLGISRVFTQGILLRELLKSKNQPSNTNLLLDSEAFRDNNKVPNRWRIADNEYTSNNENFKLASLMQGNTDSEQYHEYSSIFSIVGGSPTLYGVASTDAYRKNFSNNLQQLYGTSVGDEIPSKVNIRLNTAYYSVDTVSPNGGGFTNSSYDFDSYITYGGGYLVYLIKNYNLERNAFNLNQLQPGNPGTLNSLQEYDIPGFQDLISKTIGSFSDVYQFRTLTTPASIIQKNNGAYYNGGGSNVDILRPEGGAAELGSAESMMAKTVVGNPFEDDDFLEGKRGVRHIINTIKGGKSQLSANYDPQNNRAYITGLEDNKPRVSRQRYSIANPYAPSGAGKLVFFLKNYSSGEQYYFPPYISSFQNTENASWNTTNFLGRPEAVYTYNNSSRDASITFFVLTDYGQRVSIGTDWSKDFSSIGTSTSSENKIDVSISSHFTDSDKQQNKARKLEDQDLDRQKAEIEENLQIINEKIDSNNTTASVSSVASKEIDMSSGGTPFDMSTAAQEIKTAQEAQAKAASAQIPATNDELKQERDNLLKELAKINANILINDAQQVSYSESNKLGLNVYNLTDSKNSKDRLDIMTKNLMFQPAFFSGDKVDFLRKMEFLAKMTRPSAAPSQPNTGFSFTKPPICHIHLGDWWNHDIVVNSVSFDYADAPWTLDEGRVQPMWASVSINFNIIGPYKAIGSRPPLSTDIGGMYSPTRG